MNISIEISYYPLIDGFEKPVDTFIEKLAENKNIIIESGTMSTLLTGPYEEVMEIINKQMKPYLEKYPSVFTLKISSACNCKSESTDS